jgi:hypothetical protein
MAGATDRSEYYWMDGRVVRRKGLRPSGYGPWQLAGNARDLVCAIERSPAGIERVIPGRAHSREREETAVLMEYDRYAPLGRPDLGRDIPAPLLNEVRKHVASAVSNVTRQFQSLSNEERTTGALTSAMHGEFTSGGWRVEITTQGYSSVGERAKEPRIGADLGVIIDVANGAERVMKGMLVQAKRALHVPDDPLDLPQLREQLNRCQEVTRESYGWIFTPQGIMAVREGETAPIEIEEQFADALTCTRGDPKRRVVASAVDRDYTIELLASGPRSRGS